MPSRSNATACMQSKGWCKSTLLINTCNCRMLKVGSQQKKRRATEGWRRLLLKVRACCAASKAARSCSRNLQLHGGGHGPARSNQQVAARSSRLQIADTRHEQVQS